MWPVLRRAVLSLAGREQSNVQAIIIKWIACDGAAGAARGRERYREWPGFGPGFGRMLYSFMSWARTHLGPSGSAAWFKWSKGPYEHRRRACHMQMAVVQARPCRWLIIS